ncbi:MAG: trypsin-like peptidase domain-containing protein [Thermoguttaceae bacterium]
MIQSTLSVTRVWKLVFGLATLLAWTAVAGAEESQELFAKVKGSVVEIDIGKSSLGSGLVVDAERGIIATNYHVIASAVELKDSEKVTIIFPADEDKKRYVSDGFFEFLPGKDLALIHMDPKQRKLKALKLADSLPSPGEHAYAMGSALGYPLTFTEGMISTIRIGKQLAELPMAAALYKALHYDMDAVWIQHGVAISHGNSGGPLFNAKGEVIGQNTWAPPGGNGIYFAISSRNLKKLLTGASKYAKPYKNLPPVPNYLKSGSGGGEGPGDPVNTLATWKTFNRAMIAFNKKIEQAEKKMEAVPKPDLRNPQRGRNARAKKLSAALKAFGTAYTEFAGKVKTLGGDRTVNIELTGWLMREGDMLHRVGDSYNALATSTATETGVSGLEEAKIAAFKEEITKFRSHYDALRIILSRVFDRNFPTIEETESATEDSGDDGSKKDDKKAGSSGDKKSKSQEAYELRTWTSKNGKFTLRAKFRGVEDGNVKLEKEDGKVIVVPIARLCEEDQKLIEEINS